MVQIHCNRRLRVRRDAAPVHPPGRPDLPQRRAPSGGPRRSGLAGNARAGGQGDMRSFL